MQSRYSSYFGQAAPPKESQTNPCGSSGTCSYKASSAPPARRKRHIACDELFSFHCKVHHALILPLLASKPRPLRWVAVLSALEKISVSTVRTISPHCPPGPQLWRVSGTQPFSAGRALLLPPTSPQALCRLRLLSLSRDRAFRLSASDDMASVVFLGTPAAPSSFACFPPASEGAHVLSSVASPAVRTAAGQL